MTEPTHCVVLSEDGRHAIWPLSRPLPWGWRLEGTEGTPETCQRHVETICTELVDAGPGGPR